jgi:hypothetical protein
MDMMNAAAARHVVAMARRHGDVRSTGFALALRVNLRMAERVLAMLQADRDRHPAFQPNETVDMVYMPRYKGLESMYVCSGHDGQPSVRDPDGWQRAVAELGREFPAEARVVAERVRVLSLLEKKRYRVELCRVPELDLPGGMSLSAMEQLGFMIEHGPVPEPVECVGTEVRDALPG